MTMLSDERMTTAPVQQETHVPAQRVRKTAQPPRFPARLNGFIDLELADAIVAAAQMEKEPEIVIVRRWLRHAARQLGLLPMGGPRAD